MKSIFLLALCLFAAALGEDKEVFRYEDADTKQSHYMSGEPGNSVQGGWEFVSPEGQSFQMSYIADEGGFQPQADYIPIPVQDTNEVNEARNTFYSLYNEAQARLDEIHNEQPVQEGEAIVEARKRRAAQFHPRFHGHHGFRRQPSFRRPSFRQHHHHDPDAVYERDPHHGFVPVQTKSDDMEEEEEKLFKFKPYYGFVPVNEEGEEIEEEEEEEKLFKYNPYYGYVPVKKEGEDDQMEQDEEKIQYRYSPFYGYMPIKEGEEEDKPVVTYRYTPFVGYEEVKEHDEQAEPAEEVIFKYSPYHGYVPKKKGDEEEEMPANEQEEEEEEDTYKYDPFYGFVKTNMKQEEYKHHPYFGFIPADQDIMELMEKHPSYDYQMKMAENEYTYHPYHGYVPVDEEKDNAELGIRSQEAHRKKRAPVEDQPEQAPVPYAGWPYPTFATQNLFQRPAYYYTAPQVPVQQPAQRVTYNTLPYHYYNQFYHPYIQVVNPETTAEEVPEVEAEGEIETKPALIPIATLPGQFPVGAVTLPGQLPVGAVTLPGQLPVGAVTLPGQLPVGAVTLPGQLPVGAVTLPGQLPVGAVTLPAGVPFLGTPFIINPLAVPLFHHPAAAPLDENDFPVFPYDPKQEEPAAEEF